MARPVSNPPNPWRAAAQGGYEVEWLGEPPDARVEVFEERAKSILARNDSPDVPFTWSVNPYRGCQHACAYCYARPGHEHLGFGAGTDFDTKIVVKVNAAERLREALARKRVGRSEWIAFSGVTDPYQPLEASYRLTRQCLEACLDFRRPVGLITKSALVRRDVDLLAELTRKAGARVFLSIPFADEANARAVEPLGASPKLRFDALRALSDAGVPTGVSLSPMIPGLNDPDIPEVLERARDAGATRAFMILLRLPTSVRPVFEERLRERFPLRADKVLSQLEACRVGQTSRASFGARMRGEGARWLAIRDLYELHARRLGFETSREEEVEPLTPHVPPGGEQLELF
ncbi:MAG: PA0069 family radical SAM protein [Planctomycetota bacterium]